LASARDCFRRLRRHRARVAVVLAAACLVLLTTAAVGQGDLASRRNSLQSAIGADSQQLDNYRGRLSDLEARLSSIESSLSVQRQLLLRLQTDLNAARTRFGELKRRLVFDRAALAAQLVAQYESPQPDLVQVVLESRGFTDMLERVRNGRLIARRNTETVRSVALAKKAVAAQAERLAVDASRQRRVVAAVVVEREQVVRVRLALLARQSAVQRDRARHASQLRSVEHQLAVLQRQAAAAQAASFGGSAPPGAGFTGGGFTTHAGEFGFFPAAGTNYSVGEEPQIAARLDALGKALHLHLIGISGYRSPQHSVEVGGFADDPHTRGEASDTPGVEGVAESTLLQFGLTRPFPGAAEADHIQLS
jgi:peptidoglycan hydrolase CwlO-like protein